MIFRFPQVQIPPMTCVMVDGSFDPLHEGHIAYFKAAAELGLPVLCNVAPDSWTSQKHQILLPISQRAVVLDAIRYISHVLVGCESTEQALRTIKPKFFVKGNDWLKRGGIPLVELEVCKDTGTEVRYVDTVLNSSSELLRSATSFKGNI